MKENCWLLHCSAAGLLVCMNNLLQKALCTITLNEGMGVGLWVRGLW